MEANKTQHTPEPWRVETKYSMGLAITDQHEETNICSTGAFHGYLHIQQANAARIVECVNAMAGIPDPKEWVTRARQLTNTHNEQQVEIAILKADRDELLVAIQKAVDECCDLIATPAGNALEAAITKAKGGQS